MVSGLQDLNFDMIVDAVKTEIACRANPTA